MELQAGRTSLCANYQPDSTTFKNATVTKTAIKQASAFNETSTEPVICIKAASKQGSPIIKKVIKSGSTGAPEFVAHNPWLASNTPSSETNKHINYRINCYTRKQEWILNASIQIVVPPEHMHLTDTRCQWPPNNCLSKTWGVDTQGRFFVTLYNELCYTPQQVSPGHHDQDGVVFVEERKWCIKETATETPLKETQDLSFQSRDKPRSIGAVTNIKSRFKGAATAAATKYSLITPSKKKYPKKPCTQAHPITCTAPWGGEILVLGATAENVGFQPWWPLDLAMHKLGSTTTTAVNLQWTSDGYANMQGRTDTMAGSKLNTRWIMVNPYYIFKHKFNNHLPVLATLPPSVVPIITQW
jgi:hypothetical protein